MSGSRANLIKCVGLVTSGNELSLPEGSLRQATNVNIDEKGVITPRRGFNDYGLATGGSESLGNQAKQIIEYKDSIIRHYSNKLEYEDSNGVFQTIVGSHSELRDGYRIKWQEANSNVYFTTDEGIKKLSAKNRASLNEDMVENAGGLKSSYGEGTVVPTVGGFLTPNSKVAYRILYGKRDSSNNLIFGAPSSRFSVTNYSKKVVRSEESTVTFSNTGGSPGSPLSNGDYIIYENSTGKYTIYCDTDETATEPKDGNTIGSTYIKVDVSSAITDSVVAANIFANDISNNIPNVTVTPGTSTFTITSTEEDNIEGLTHVSTTTPDVIDIDTPTEGAIDEGDFATVKVTGVVPTGATTDYFYQVYRSRVLEAPEGFNIDDLDAGDELNLVYEAALTEDDISNGEFSFEDTQTETFRNSSAPLYTNQVTGEGILQANEAPPIALDVTLFRNSMFYANTKSRHKFTLDLVSINDFVSGKTRLVIGNSTISRYYTFVGQAQVTEVELTTNPSAGDYLLANSANNKRKYAIYFGGTGDNPEVSGAFAVQVEIGSDATETASNIKDAFIDNVDFTVDSSTNTVIFTYNNNGYSFTYDNNSYSDGFLEFPKSPNPSFSTITNSTLGKGELTDTEEGGDILLSGLVSVAQSLDETARSIVKVVTQDNKSPVNAFYLSTSDDLSGQMLFENKKLEDEPFYIAIDSGYDKYERTNTYQIDPVTEKGDRVRFDGYDYIYINNVASTGNDPSGTTSDNAYWQYINLGGEFSPELPNFKEFTHITGDGDTTILTLANHGLVVGDERYISYLQEEAEEEYDGTKSYDGVSETLVSFNGNVYKNKQATTGKNDGSEDPSGTINNNTYWDYVPETFAGVYTIIEVNGNNFTIEVETPATVSNFEVTYSSIFEAIEESDNEEKGNRVYYSKVNEPEAVPIVNYIDIGPKDEEIKRILALRDNLFVLKDDGIYIVSGTSAPNFNVRLLDNTKIIAPDSAVVLNNQIFCLTAQGITMITDSGAGVISSGIENLIDNITNQDFNYAKNTFGIPYENDRAYIMFAPTRSTDTTATQAFRYNIFEQTWSRWEYNATCGHVMDRDNKLYIGDGDRNYVMQERKNNSRTDHAERSFNATITTDGVNQETVQLSQLTNVEVNDVITQTQEVSIAYFNNRLLKKSDFFDTGIELTGFISPTNPIQLTTTYTHKLENNSEWEVLVTKDDGSGLETFVETYTVTVIDDNNFTIDYDNSDNSIVDLDFRGYYLRTFSASIGDNMATKLQAFNDHLAEIDPNSFDADRSFTLSNIKEKTEELVDELNHIDSPTSIKTYKKPTAVTYEAYIVSKDVLRNQVDLHAVRPWVEGPIQIHKHIEKTIEWNPQHFGDPSALKQIRYMTIIFDQNNFYNATAKFATDAAQAVKEVNFKGKGIGYWSDMPWADPNHYWGGVGNDIPFRNPVPRNKQKCRYISLTFEHKNAREFFKILGMTAVVRPISDRAYR